MVQRTLSLSLSSLSFSAGISNLSFPMFFLLFPLPGQSSPSCDFFPSLSYLRSLLVSQSPFFSDLP